MQSMKEQCCNCKYYYNGNLEHTSVGVCRRHAPIGVQLPNTTIGNNHHTFPEWPHVKSFYWCGDFSPSTEAFGRKEEQ